MLIALIVAAPLMHAGDRLLNGRGFQDQHHRSFARLQLDDGSVSGILSVQSIRTAVTTFILTGLVSQIPKVNGLPTWEAVTPFKLQLGVFVGGVLLISLVTTLVASLCFDYSIRFTWEPPEARSEPGSLDLENTKRMAANTKMDLRMKAKNLNAIGFYCLMWSLAALPTLLHWGAAFFAGIVVYGVTWSYYFFPTIPQDKVYKSSSPVPAPLADAMVKLVARAVDQVNAMAAREAARSAADQTKKAEQLAKDTAEAAEKAKESAAKAATLANSRVEGEPPKP
jgi:hypothetical protein